MLISELARRLRVTTRTLRHYESIGVLVPGAVDETTGYRSYDASALARGMQIEQLKAAGLSLSEIRAVLDGAEPLDVVLRRRRDELSRSIDHAAQQRSTITALLESQPHLTVPRIVEVPAQRVVSATAIATAEDLGPCIRHQIQRLRRTLKREEPGGSWTFAARFALDLDDEVTVTVAGFTAFGELWPAHRAVAVDCTGPPHLLPLAYDVALTAAEVQSITGVVQETYHDLGPAPRTTVAVLTA